MNQQRLKNGQTVFIINLSKFYIIEVEVYDFEDNMNVYFGKDNDFDIGINKKCGPLELYDFTKHYPAEAYTYKVKQNFTDVSYMIYSTRKKAEQYFLEHIAPYQMDKAKKQADFFMTAYMEVVSNMENIEKRCNAIQR